MNTEIILNQKITQNSTPWLDILYFFVRDAVERISTSLHRFNTKENAADGFAKALGIEVIHTYLHDVGAPSSYLGRLGRARQRLVHGLYDGGA